ncbi:conserved hypothetical protein [Leptospira interrogans serovar Manilae]|uniref:Uncharacterized protein n=1 Tax=Leptospira interrogans serovar Manilae TaxID=214675 RepID=A0AAQ1NW57_LEPIR|nr:hypothetical protein LEP1GSC013_2350 [Leptospira interrogans serovar Valbuzzi str. Duyster]EMN73324.1 hypothetical protein LEP1GSC100_0073 [Leptospira interrogans serovar Bataviae str. UI 08561]ENO72506.1 hypothetical protein LEP1GSC012_3714 [Leptospira interrogans serovar Valbuzzi str. Valbuzzi]SOR60583.1 conserved hypothetical protein [Leptospira interrogans serovar Manilae]
MPYYSTEKQNLSFLGEEIRGKVREEYEILNPDKICDLV